MDNTTRRRVLRTAGGVALVGLAGCTGNGGGDGGDGNGRDGGDGNGGGDGTLLDRRGQDTLTVRVGAEGNDGNFAYDPSAVVVSAGTEVRWEWTGQGNPHNVEALPEEQLGKSDYEFSSGEPEGRSGVKHTETRRQAHRDAASSTPRRGVKHTETRRQAHRDARRVRHRPLPLRAAPVARDEGRHRRPVTLILSNVRLSRNSPPRVANICT